MSALANQDALRSDPKAVALVTDSTADLTPEEASALGVRLVSLTVNMGGQAYLDRTELAPQEFYRGLRAGAAVSTSQPSPGSFEVLYRELLGSCDHVLSLHISAKLSGTLAAAQIAADAIDPTRISVIDSQGASAWLGLQVMAARRLLDQGADCELVIKKLDSLRAACYAFFTIPTLAYLHKGGRIGGAHALIGSILQLRPVLQLSDGEVQPYERTRTYEKALARIVELAHERAGQYPQVLGIAHADAPDVAARLGRELADIASQCHVFAMGPVLACHVGPGLVGIIGFPAELMPD